MNEKLHIAIQKAGERDGLTMDERARMRSTLHSYMAMKPIGAAPEGSIRSQYFFSFISMRPVALALVAVLFISSAGVSYAAEGSLPGDALYAVKTHINEPLQGALALTASSKTAWAMQVAGTRVQEAATLAAEGKLDDQTQKDLQASFSEHAQIAANNIAEQASTSPDLGAEVATRFEAQLTEYQRVLAQVAEATHAQTTALADAVAHESAHVAGIRMDAEASVAATTSTAAIAASRMRDAAVSAVDGSSHLVRLAVGALAPSSAAQVSVQLQDASDTISAGERYLTGNEAPRALASFSDALAATEKLGVFLQTSNAIHERTGLRITEPTQGHSSSGSGPSSDTGAATAVAVASEGHAASTMRLATTENPDASAPAPEAPRPMMFAAKMAAGGEAGTGSVATSATSSEASSTNEAAPTSTNDQGDNGGDSWRGGGHGGFLPIALPDGGGLDH